MIRYWKFLCNTGILVTKNLKDLRGGIKMKKLISVLLAIMLLATPFVFAEEKSGDDVYNFEELTGEDIDDIVIRSGADGIDYSTAEVAEDAYNSTANDFSDWAADYIIQAKDIGLLKDTSGLVYKENITREKFCELIYDFILIKQGGITTPEYKNRFIDTDNEKVVVLNGAEIIYGKSDTEFAPNDLLTREEAATIIVRMINKVMPMSATEMYFEYGDINDISEWALSAVQVMGNLGFMNGVGENKFAPKDNYTVEQSIATLIRMYNANNYEYITPLGTVTSKTDCSSHINFGIETDARIDFIKDKTTQTKYMLPGPFKAFTNETSAMYITFDGFAKIFDGKWELINNTFAFNYDASSNIVLSEYTPNETSGGEWPNKTEATPVIFFVDTPTILINGEEKSVKGQYGGKVYDTYIMMYNNELYIPVQMVAELLDCDIAATNILWNK